MQRKSIIVFYKKLQYNAFAFLLFLLRCDIINIMKKYYFSLHACTR